MIMSTVDVLRNHPSVQALHPATLYENACRMASDAASWADQATAEWRSEARRVYNEVMSLPYLNVVKEHIDAATENVRVYHMHHISCVFIPDSTVVWRLGQSQRLA